MAAEEQDQLELPGQLEKIFAILSRQYRRQGKTDHLSVIVNSTCSTTPWRPDDPYDRCAHSLCFKLPSSLYHSLFQKRRDIAAQLAEDINDVSTVGGEYISDVSLELQDDPGLKNWRSDSGAQLPDGGASAAATSEDPEGIWEPGYFRAFLCHKSEDKKEVTKLKASLLGLGITAFVAHEDIEPAKEWQGVIDAALRSMDVLVALLTERFSDSNWTDQEIGIAIGRRVPVIPVRLGKDPYGFIGKYQALPGDLARPGILARSIFDLIWTQPHWLAGC